MEEIKAIFSKMKKGEPDEKQPSPRDLHDESFGDVLTVTGILQKISLVRGVRAAFIVDKDGLLVAGTGMEQVSMENIGGMLNTFLAYIGEIGEESKLGEFSEFALTYSSGILFFRVISPQFFYVVIGEKEAHNEKISLMMDGYRYAVLSFLGVKDN